MKEIHLFISEDSTEDDFYEMYYCHERSFFDSSNRMIKDCKYLSLNKKLFFIIGCYYHLFGIKREVSQMTMTEFRKKFFISHFQMIYDDFLYHQPQEIKNFLTIDLLKKLLLNVDNYPYLDCHFEFPEYDLIKDLKKYINFDIKPLTQTLYEILINKKEINYSTLSAFFNHVKENDFWFLSQEKVDKIISMTDFKIIDEKEIRSIIPSRYKINR